MLKLRRDESVKKQVEKAIYEEIKNNFLWASGQTYIAIYPDGKDVVADIGGRQKESFSPDEKYFLVVHNGLEWEKDLSVAEEWGLIKYDENIGKYESEIEDNEKLLEEFLKENDMIYWDLMEELADQAWKELDEAEEEGQ